jgi:ankyrin repeat protein
MAKIKITEEDLNEYKSNKNFLREAFTNSIKAQDIKVFELLFQSTALKSCLDIKPWELFVELLELVIDDKNVDIVKLIVNQLEVDLRQQKASETKETLLDIAAYYGAKDIVTFLLEKGFDPNNKDNNGHTSLHKAVMVNSSFIISLLIRKGANINIQDTTDGNTPLHLATLLKFPAIIKQLKWHGAQSHIKNKAGIISRFSMG